VIKILYIKRSLQVEKCLNPGEASFKVKRFIGSGPSFAICVFSVILTFQSNARAVSARVSRFFTIGSSYYCCKCARVFRWCRFYFFERSSSSLLSTVVGIVESAFESVFGVEGRIIFEPSSSSCCRRSSVLLKVHLRSSSVSKVVLFLSARIRIAVEGRLYC
jgi:hypothetical protein